MQTLRKKTSPCKYKNEPSRFLGDGVSFKAKLIGILEVSEARGDRMCQEALADLKMAIRAAGEHKQRITINIAIDGLRLRDEKTGDSLYHHPVHKISFIAQDMSDSRAFGYIFGSPDTGHRFFGIKTDKAASQVVIAMRDLFQVVFELKKKEIELAKQHIEQKSRFGTTTSSSIFSDTTLPSTKTGYSESSTIQESSSSRTCAVKDAPLKSFQNGDSHSTAKMSSTAEPSSAKSQSTIEGAHGGNSEAIADLVDLELELSSIQQGIHQMERITPSDPFGPNKDDPFNSDPFGDSFISFPQKPFLPPPPSSRDRQSRTTSETSSSLFSPKTPKTADTTTTETNLFKVSQEDTASCDWFTPTGSDSLFEDATVASEDILKESESNTQESNASILSQFDVFTELDPLGTGRSKPYVDKKLFFQELKNPPKKVLKDLVSTQPSDTSLFAANFDTTTQTSTSSNSILYPTDPFVESDPFDKTDPFEEADFTKSHDPFDTDFIEDFKVFNKQENKTQNKVDLSDTLKKMKQPIPQDKLQPLFPSPLSKSPNRSSIFEKQMSLQSNHVSPRGLSFLSKQNTFDLKFEDKKYNKISQLHENPSLDMSSESECAPEPPPRPATNISPIKPPPLPPKKQPGDLTKPPPRPPHTEESHYDYMESYETGPNNLDSLEIGPPLPVPSRKSRLDQSDFGVAPQRPKKQFQGSSDEDYLTPVPPPLLPPQKKDSFRSSHYKHSDGILLPPPMKKESSKRHDRHLNTQNTVASLLDSKPKLSTSPTAENFNLTPDTLDITLSQLTLSGLNELATKLKIPPSQLSNMTLVQLTSYLSNYVKGNSTSVPNESDATIPTFEADFSANFNDLTSEATSKSEPYDRYAVFRELLQHEEIIKPVDEIIPEEIQQESIIEEETKTEVNEEMPPDVEIEVRADNSEINSAFPDTMSNNDRYAALRDIIIEESGTEQKETNLEVIEEEQPKIEEDMEKEQNDLNVESFKNETEIKDKINEVENNIIEYESPQDQEVKEKLNIETQDISPVTVKSESNKIKSPVPVAVTEIIQTNNHLTSGSLSDAVTGSSPEMDNLANSDTVEKKNVENTTGESWAIFDTPNLRQEIKEKQVQSEEGVSPWSSDSKEFGNGSPLDWQQRRDSESEGDWDRKRRERDGTWWDTQGEIEGTYEKPKHRSTYVRDRRSTDSYEEDWYEAEEEQRPRRRTRQPTHAWGRTGGQSSSSRDVSPWEEEEPRGTRRDETWPCRRARGPSWDRLHRRDSWDEDDDYDYEGEYVGKFHCHERHGSRDSDRGSRDSDRHSTPRGEPPDDWERSTDQWPEQDRRHARRKTTHEERWCRGDWEREEKTAFPGKDKSRYASRYSNIPEGKWRSERERKREQDRYYKRDHSQESPWEDEYSNDPDEPPQSPRYLSTRRNWKRPSSASEMDRKSGEIKSRQPYYIGTGGSDGERDRRYKSNRRSRSRDSQFTEMAHNRHKPDPGLTLRYPHRNRDKMYSQKFENNFTQEVLSKAKLDVKLDQSNNKKSVISGRKKNKEIISPSTETDSIQSKSRKQHLMFENDFVNSETDSPIAVKAKFNFDNDFETSEAESPTITRHSKYTRAHTMYESDHNIKKNVRSNLKQTVGFENEFPKEPRTRQTRNDFQEKDTSVKSTTSPKPHLNLKQKSMFEDDFSPTDKSESQCNDDNGICIIPEEPGVGEQRVSFTENNLDRISTSERRKQKHILSKTRLASNIRGDNLKKSDSVNIFARENDPFDDDFFSGREGTEIQKVDSKASGNIAMEYKWTEDFDSFDIPEETNK